MALRSGRLRWIVDQTIILLMPPGTGSAPPSDGAGLFAAVVGEDIDDVVGADAAALLPDAADALPDLVEPLNDQLYRD